MYTSDMSLSVDRASIASAGWFSALSPDIQSLIQQSLYIMDHESEVAESEEIYDYGYVVFSAAKAYEGFLKHFLYDIGLLSDRMYRSGHFRIGKALNPDLPKRYRDEEWLHAKMYDVCGGDLASQLWRVWRKGRNQVFHYRGDQTTYLTYAQAKEIVYMIIDAMRQASECELRHKR